MNFFGHGQLAAAQERAAAREPAPPFVLGAMLPDLASMAGGRLAGADDAVLARGLAFHQDSDARFHAAPAFRSACRDAVARLERAGVARGAARGAAHAGLELALDGYLAARGGVPACYRAALALGAAELPGLRWRAAPRRAPLGEVCARLARSPLPEAYADPEELAARLVRLLSARPRLAPGAGDRRALRAWAGELCADVALLEALARAGAPSA